MIAAINPFEETRNELKENYATKTVWIKCDIPVLINRDTKGLYKRALLHDNHPDKLFNLTGVNDTYEPPLSPDLVIDTSIETATQSIQAFYDFLIFSSASYLSKAARQ
jgi:adenylylsulfate kinase-like enzyme